MNNEPVDPTLAQHDNSNQEALATEPPHTLEMRKMKRGMQC